MYDILHATISGKDGIVIEIKHIIMNILFF